MAGRTFNALNGEELIHKLLAETEKLLRADSRLRVNVAYPQVSWAITFKLEVYPPPAVQPVISGRGVISGPEVSTEEVQAALNAPTSERAQAMTRSVAVAEAIVPPVIDDPAEPNSPAPGVAPVALEEESAGEDMQIRGGAVGRPASVRRGTARNPDAVRREIGLPVPRMQQTKDGQIVDLPTEETF